MGRMKLVASDLVLSFLWVWAGSLVKLFVYTVGPATPHEAELLKIGLSIGYMFVFAWFDKLTGGGSYNPLTVLVYTVAGNGEYLFAAFCRIPAQMLGSVAGVWLLKEVFPQIGHGARLNADIHYGALVEGLATFGVVAVSMTLKHKEVNSFFLKTWISSISKMTLHILSSDLTGGIMNPASVRTRLTSYRKNFSECQYPCKTCTVRGSPAKPYRYRDICLSHHSIHTIFACNSLFPSSFPSS